MRRIFIRQSWQYCPHPHVEIARLRFYLYFIMKRLLIFMGPGFVLLLVLLTVLNFCFPGEWVKEKIESAAAKRLNGTLRIRTLAVRPFSSVRAGGVAVLDRDGREVLGLDSLVIRYDLSALLRRTLRVRTIIIMRPRAGVWRRDSAWNLTTLMKSAPAAARHPAEPLDKKAAHGDPILRKLPVNVRLDHFEIRNMGAAVWLPESTGFSGFNLALNDLFIRRVDQSRVKMDLTFDDTLFFKIPLAPDQWIHVLLPLDLRSRTGMERFFRGTQELELRFPDLSLCIRDAQDRELQSVRLNLALRHALEIREDRLTEHFRVRLDSIRATGRVRVVLASTEVRANLTVPYNWKNGLCVDSLRVDTLALALAGQTLILASAKVKRLLTDPVVEIRMQQSPCDLSRITGGLQTLLPAGISGVLNLGGSTVTAAVRRLQGEETRAELRLKITGAGVHHSNFTLSGTDLQTRAALRFRQGLPYLESNLSLRGQAQHCPFLFNTEIQVPGRPLETRLNALFQASAPSLKGLAPGVDMEGASSFKASLDLRGVERVVLNIETSLRNFRMPSRGIPGPLPEIRMVQFAKLGILGLRARGLCVDPRSAVLADCRLDELSVAVNDFLQVRVQGTVQDMGRGPLDLEARLDMENTGADALLKALSGMHLSGLAGKETVTARIKGRLMQPLKQRIQNGKVLVPFTGDAQIRAVLQGLGFHLNPQGSEIRSAGGDLSFSLHAQDSAFQGEFTCSTLVSDIKGMTGPVEAVRSAFFNCQIMARDGNFIEVRRLQGGARNYPVELWVQGAGSHLLSNPASDIRGRVWLAAAETLQAAPGVKVRGGAGFEFNVEIPSWKNGLLDFVGYLYFDNFGVWLDSTLASSGVTGRIRFQQRVDFSAFKPGAPAGPPRICLAPLGRYEENPLKQLDYREMDVLYRENGRSGSCIEIPRIYLKAGRHYALDSFFADISYENNILDLRHFEMKMFNGTLVGRSRVRMPDGRLWAPESLMKNMEYDIACQLNGLNFDWLDRGFQDSGYYAGRGYEIDFIFDLAGRDVSDLKNLNFSGHVLMPFIGPRIAKTFFRKYIDPQNEKKILSTINSFLSRGAHVDKAEFVIANGRYGVNINFWPAGSFEVPRRNPLSNVLEMITLPAE